MKRASTKEKKSERRESILARARSWIADRSFDEIRLSDLAHELGIVKGTLYLYFASKEALYLGILSDGLERANQSYPLDPQADVIERLRRAVAVSIQFYDTHRDFLQLIATEEPRLAAARNRLIQELRQRGLDFFSSLVGEGIADGTFRRTDPRLAALTIMGGIRSILLHYGELRQPAELSMDLCRIVLEGLATTGARNSRKASSAK